MHKKIAVLLILISFFGCSDSTNEKTQTPFEQAQNHLRKFETEAADSIFKQLADSDLSDPSGYFGLGLKFEREFRFLDALHVYMSIIESNPSFVPALKRGYELFKMYELESEMIRSAVSLYELDPKNADNLLIFAEGLIIHNDSRRARKILFESNLKVKRPGEYHALVALSLLKNDAIDSAEAEYNNALASKSNSATFYMRAADYIQELGMYDSAIALSNSSVQVSDDDFDYLTRHFFRTLQVLNIDEARNVRDKVVSMGGGKKLRSVMDIFIFHRLKEHPPAIKASVNYRKYVPKGMSSSFYELSARGPLLDGLEIDQEMMYMLNIMERENYNFDFQILLRYLIAVEYAKFDSPVQALGELAKLPGIASTRKQARLMKIRSQFNCGLTEDAINSINALEKSHRNQQDWLTGLGRVLWRIRNGQDYQRSEELLDKALIVDRWYLPAFENLLDMSRHIKDYKNGLKQFEKYPYFAERFAHLNIARAEFLVKTGEIEKGLKLLENKFPNCKGSVSLIKEILDYLQAMGEKEASNTVADIIIEDNLNNNEAIMIAAGIYNDNQNYDRVLEMANYGLKLNPDNYLSKTYLASAWYWNGEKNKGLKQIEELAMAHVKDPTVNLIYSQMLIDEGKDFSKASNLARRANFGSNMSYKTWMNLCYAYYQMGRNDLTRGEARKSSMKFKDRPGPFYWMGVVYYEDGHPEAEENLKKAISLGLNGKQLEIAKSIINRI